MIALENVSLNYSVRSGFFKQFKHMALDDISFDVKKGDVFGVIGGNGSGKSTLLRVLAGILTPDAGKVDFDSGYSRALLSLGLGFNNQLTGRDNALLSCIMNGMALQEARSTLDSIKEFTGLGKFFDQPVKSYSSGMRSKLGFATAVLTDVDLLLIDEVLSVGDRAFKHKAEALLLEKLKGDKTVIYVSHSEDQVERLCNRAIWLSSGVIASYGSSASVVDAYKSSVTI